MSNLKDFLTTFFQQRRYSRSKTSEGDVYAIRNPWVLLRRSGTLEFTDGTRLKFNTGNKQAVLRIAMFALEEGVRFGADEGRWRIDSRSDVIETPEGIKFLSAGFDGTIFAETFLHDVHFVDFDLKGRTVVEGGGFVGDTALYYANRGATVYSFEPDPRSFELAKRNIALNAQLSDSVVLRNWAIGRDGEVYFPIAPGGSGASSVHATAPGYAKVRSVSVKTVLSEFRIEKPFLLHLDVKGEEYTVIEEDVLNEFERLRIEYSPYLTVRDREQNRTLRYLLTRLDKLGFREVRVFKHNNGRYDLSNHGTIDARKGS